MMGRPPLFNTVDELEKLVDDYFEYIKGEFEWVAGSDEYGNPQDQKEWTRGAEQPTITGLALFLGFESRQSVYDYEKKNKDFSYTIKKARLRVEANYEQHLFSRTPTGAIFALKNLGWADKQEIDHSSTDGTMTPKTTIKFE